VVLSDYGKGGLKHIERMIEAARAAGKPVLVDPKGMTTRATRGPPFSRQTARSSVKSRDVGRARRT
jgi:hypothetical protein